mmetsp:Transcript_26938/g.60852  ORF Transcript_26938/g.60852 Transcript_26938/m.60852 type:complete len:206 (+) Transcript_26938:255-872(+)
MLIGNLVPRREDALPACLPAQGQVLHTTKYWLPAHPTPTRAASGRRPSPNAQADGTNDDAAGSYTRATPPQSVHPNSVPLLKHAKSCPPMPAMPLLPSPGARATSSRRTSKTLWWVDGSSGNGVVIRIITPLWHSEPRELSPPEFVGHRPHGGDLHRHPVPKVVDERVRWHERGDERGALADLLLLLPPFHRLLLLLQSELRAVA